VSLVEKALQKLRTEREGGGSVPVQSATPQAVPPPAPSAPLPAAPRRVEFAAAPVAGPSGPVDFDSPLPTLQIDLAALVAARLLAPESEAHRAAGEYRVIKRAVLADAFRDPAEGGRSRLVAVTSALSGDGKTHTTLNLALSLARERDYGVVLVDADVAKCHLSKLLGLQGAPGLIDLLSAGEPDVFGALRRTSVSQLVVLPAGNRAEDATELLTSHRMTAICNQLLSMFPRAIVLLDSPPLLQTSEAHAVASAAGQTLLVVKAGTTPRTAVSEAVGRIPDPSTLRVVLNQVDLEGMSGYYHYGQYGTYAQ
jgi:protein-tyrosine kinase